MAKSSLTQVRKIKELSLAEKKRLVARGRKAIALVLKMKRASEHAFYEMGKALAVLKEDRIVRVLGHPSFSALCTIELKMSHDQADQFIAIATNFDPKVAAQLSPSKAAAIIDLARAFGKKTTPGGIVSRGTVTLPSGKTLDIRAASAAAISSAARMIRAQAPTEKTTRGVRVSKEDAAFVAKLARALKPLGGRIEAVAAGKVSGAKMRIFARVADTKALGEALLAAAKSESHR